MLNKTNVMIFPSGAENAIDVYDSLKYNLHFDIYGVSARKDHAEFIYPNDRYIIDDDLYITNKSFISIFNNIINKYEIRYIIPTHDIIACFLMEHCKEINACIICSPYETAKIAMNKHLMYDKLKGCSFLPQIYSSVDTINSYPVFIKPQIGAGGKGAYIVYDRMQIEDIISRNSDIVICDYLPGKEYTVDCFTNRKGKLLFAGARTRERITMGITFHSKRVEDDREFINIAETLNKMFVFRGAWFFQVKESSEGILKIMEFSVRQAGTMAFFRQLGINFAALSLFDAMEIDVRILFNDYKMVLDRCIKSTYRLEYLYRKLYIDYDDTLIIQNKVNKKLMGLIYQSINLNKKVILITKHIGKLGYSLKKYRINEELFDEIIVLDNKKNKWDYIDHGDAIFVDNYFYDREMVKNICNIPVFDVDAIDCLMDDSSV